jgi:hypothetical protein
VHIEVFVSEGSANVCLDICGKEVSTWSCDAS